MITDPFDYDTYTCRQQMTDSDVKREAEHLLRYGYLSYSMVMVLERLVRLLVDNEARGEVVPACTQCHALQPQLVPAHGVPWWKCRSCGNEFSKPIYYQRVPRPGTPR